MAATAAGAFTSARVSPHRKSPPPSQNATVSARASQSGSSLADFALSSSSPYRAAGTDARDLGADIATVATKVAGVAP